MAFYSLSIPSSTTIKDKVNKYTVYEVHISLPDGKKVLSKRYNEFHELLDFLKKEGDHVNHFPFPEKRLFGNMDPAFIESRRHGLENWLNCISKLPEVRNSSSYLAFLELRVVPNEYREFAAGLATKPKFARVAFDWKGESDGELDLKEGDLIEYVIQNDDGWWSGVLRGKCGWFPGTYVDVMEDQALPRSTTLSSIVNVRRNTLMLEPVQKAPPAPHPIPAAPPVPKPSTPSAPSASPSPSPAISSASPSPSASRADQDRSKPARQARVLWDFAAQTETELNLKAGDIVGVYQEEEDGVWCSGEVNGQFGYFPKSYIEFLDESQFVLEIKQKAFVLWDYPAGSPSELNLSKGEVVNLISCEANSEWWEGEVNGKVGFFPATYVEKLSDEQVKQLEEQQKVKVVLGSPRQAAAPKPAAEHRAPKTQAPTRSAGRPGPGTLSPRGTLSGISAPPSSKAPGKRPAVPSRALPSTPK